MMAGVFMSGPTVAKIFHNNWPKSRRFRVSLMLDVGAVSTLSSGEGFVGRLTDDSGMDTLITAKSATKNLSIKKPYPQRTTGASRVPDLYVNSGEEAFVIVRLPPVHEPENGMRLHFRISTVVVRIEVKATGAYPE